MFIIAWKMGEETHGLDLGLLKLGKIQGLDPQLLLTVNTNSDLKTYTVLGSVGRPFNMPSLSFCWQVPLSI
jgi:hypothetical protein